MKKIFVSILLSLALFLPTAEGASTYSVTTESDSGAGSLRQTLLDANASGLDSVITIEPAVKRIKVLSSALPVSSNVTLHGNGATLEGTTTRILSVTGKLTADGLTFTKGKAPYGNGGAVLIEETGAADFLNCTFADNDASKSGGAVCVQGSGKTSFSFCTVAGNSAENGGGIAVLNGIVSLNACIVTGNTARNGLVNPASDLWKDGTGVIDNTQSYNVIGSSNEYLTPSRGNFMNVSAGNVFLSTPPKLESVNGVQVLKLSSLSGDVALDLIPKSAPNAPAQDQCGTVRPQLSALDAGAYELPPVPLVSFDIQGSPYIQRGKTADYVVSLTPADASRNAKNETGETRYENGIEWSTSDTSVITVDASGKVTAVGIGEADLNAIFHGWDAAGHPKTELPKSLHIIVGETPLPVPIVTFDLPQSKVLTVGQREIFTPKVTVMLNGRPTTLPYTLKLVGNDNTGILRAEVTLEDPHALRLEGQAPGKAKLTLQAHAANSAKPSFDERVLEVIVQNPNKGGGGGCNAGFAGLTLAGALLFLARKRA